MLLLDAFQGVVDKELGAARRGVLSCDTAFLLQLTFYLLHAGQHALQGATDLFGLIGAAFVHPQFEDIDGRPEHAKSRLAPFVGGVHWEDGLVSFLYPALSSQVKNILYRHIINDTLIQSRLKMSRE